MTLSPAPPVVLFDGGCGFCAHCLQWLYRHARPTSPAVRFQSVELSQFGVTAARASYEMLFVSADGQVHGGVSAFAGLLRTGRRPWPLVGVLLARAPVRWLAHGVYRWVAGNRHRMPGGTESCAVRITSSQEGSP